MKPTIPVEVRLVPHDAEPRDRVAFVSVDGGPRVRVRFDLRPREELRARPWRCDECGPANTPHCIHAAAAMAVYEQGDTDGE